MALATSMDEAVGAAHASEERGRTIPVVPRMDRPPIMPSLSLRVFFASNSPFVADMVISTARSEDRKGVPEKASDIASAIIFRGTGLIAGSPTAIARPGFVTVPTPLPPLITSAEGKYFRVIMASATISTPLVTSGSSPASLITAAKAALSGLRYPEAWIVKSALLPFGNGIETLPGGVDSGVA